MSTDRKRICIVTADAGGGHRMTARALEKVLTERYPWDVTVVNPYQEILGSLDEFQKRLGISAEDVYNRLVLQRGHHAIWPAFYVLCQSNIKLNWKRGTRLLEEYWKQMRPDLVLSVIPFVNQVLRVSLKNVAPDVPFATLMTDLEECRRNFWMVHPDQYFIVGTAAAEQRALRQGHPRDRLFRVSGMVIDPSFYESLEVDRAAERAMLGLAPDLPTALVMIGGHGSRSLMRVAKRLDRAGVPLQAIFLSGHDEAVGSALRAVPTSYPKAVVGFTREVARFMALADFYIGKPGPGGLTEALVKKLPVILLSNFFTLATEKPNASWAVEQGFGMSIRSDRQLPGTVRRLLQPETFARIARNVGSYRNDALQEVPGIIARALETETG